MDQVFKLYYQEFYHKTSGFIPTQPINLTLFPGDFFQIKNKEIIVLGNIYLNNLISPENCSISLPVKMSTTPWNFSSGVRNHYSGRGSGENDLNGSFEFSRQLFKFDYTGSYMFKAEDPQHFYIENWNTIQDELIIKLTQTQFSFREVYLVVDSITAANWTLTVAGEDKGELEIASEEDSFGLLDLYGHHSSKTIQSKGLTYHQRQEKRSPNFFKAKKLIVRDEQVSTFLSNLNNQRETRYEWASRFYENAFDYNPHQQTHLISENYKASVLDMLSAGDLNPNTALNYFRWADANMDDVYKLFDMDV